MKNYYIPNMPQLICGSSTEREEFFNRKYDELTKLTGEDNVLLCNAQALFDEFLNALSNATVKEWNAANGFLFPSAVTLKEKLTWHFCSARIRLCATKN